MPTETETAAAMLTLAEHYDEQNMPCVATLWRRHAAKIDPPKPTYPDGFYRWYYADGWTNYVTRKAGAWLDGYGKPDDQIIPLPSTKITPLRVLGDDEIALPRIDVDYMGPHDTTAKFMREAANRAKDLGHGSCVTEAVQAVLRAYADALDAEAGDRS